MALVFLVIAVFCVHYTMSHTYSLGSCPYVEPIHDFDMTKFLGRWYAIQKTDTESSCLIYDFKKGTKEGTFLLEQTSEKYPPIWNIDYVFEYTGKIKATNSSKMTIQFPLNIIGSSQFDVVTTDYKTYASIYTCQNVLFFKRQSATLLSRTDKLDTEILTKLRHVFDDNISDLQLNPISHDNCNEAESQILLKVKSSSTRSSINSRTVPKLPSMTHIVTNVNKESGQRIADVSYAIDLERPDEETLIDPRYGNDDEDVTSHAIDLERSDEENFIVPRSANIDEDIIFLK